jgi:hypothetical protein
MRAAREQPRLAAAKTLAAVCLLLVGVAIGARAHSNRGRAHTGEVRLVSAQRSLAVRGTDLRDARARLDATEAELRRSERRLVSLQRANRVLRRELLEAKRSRRHVKQP